MKIHIASDTAPIKKQNRSESLGFFHLLPLQILRIVITVGFTKPKTAGQALASAPELRYVSKTARPMRDQSDQVVGTG